MPARSTESVTSGHSGAFSGFSFLVSMVGVGGVGEGRKKSELEAII